MNFPIMPGTKISGRNAATVVKTAKDDRDRDFLSALDRPREPLAMPLLMRENVLTDHDRIIDHDAQHQNERKQGHEVDRYVPGRA